MCHHVEGSSRLHGAIRSPWHKFRRSLPAPYSPRTSGVDGNVAAPAAGCISHCSLKQRRNTRHCQTEPPFFPLPLFLLKPPVSLLPSLTQLPRQQNPPPLGSFTPSLPLSSSFPRGTSGSGLFPVDAQLLGSGMLSTALLSCRRELGEADDLGRRAPGAGAGVLARPHPGQADEPCSAQVGGGSLLRSLAGPCLGAGQPPFACAWKDPASPGWHPGDDLGFGSSSRPRWLLPAWCQTRDFCPLPSP